MFPAVCLPALSPVPVAELSRDEIRSLAHTYGHHRLQASSRFACLLPLVEKYQLYHDDGCHNVYEWAAKFAGMDMEEVDRILALYTRLGRFDCLWRLLGEGVGVSKLERVAPHVTAANAEWLAERVKTLPKPELELLLKGNKQQAKAKAKAKANADAKADKAEGPQPTSSKGEAVLPGKTISFISGLIESPEDSPQAFAGPGIPSGLPEDHPDDVTIEDLDDAIAAEGARNEAAATEGATTESTTTELPTTAGDFLPEPANPADTPLDADVVTTVRLSLELDAIGEKLIRDLREVCERAYGRPVGLGELFTNLAKKAIVRGEVPGLDTEPKAEDAPAPAAASQSMAADAPSRTFQARILQVVVSIAETGWKFIRTAIGWVPVAAGALAGFLDPGQPIPLANMRRAAIAAAAGASGSRYVPAAVERYIRARSGGYCEVGNCRRRLVDIHHKNRFAFDPSHHPDALVACCEVHHPSAHRGIIRNEHMPPASWEVIEEGEQPRMRTVDHQFQEYRDNLRRYE